MKTQYDISVKVYLETGYPVKQTKEQMEAKEPLRYPLKLKVIHTRIVKRYVLKYPALKEPGFEGLYMQTILLSEDEYNRAMGERPQKQYKVIQKIIERHKSKAMEAIQVTPFSFETFERVCFGKIPEDKDLFSSIKNRAEQFTKENKFNTATILNALLKALKDHTGKEKYPFVSVTVDFLKAFQQYLEGVRIGKKDNQHPLSRTTISIYLRALQAVFNDKAPEGTPYPFSKSPNDRGKFKIPKWEGHKRALTQKDIRSIAGYDCVDCGDAEREKRQWYRDMFIFSFLSKGMNFTDVSNLKFSDITSDFSEFRYYRAKTNKVNSDPALISVEITPEIARIIDRCKNNTSNRNEYVFPILHNEMTPEQKHTAVKQFIKRTNKYLGRICKDLTLPPITSYYARHAYATILQNSGAPVAFISKSLGHRDVQTTESYLGQFERKVQQQYAELIDSVIKPESPDNKPSINPN